MAADDGNGDIGDLGDTESLLPHDSEPVCRRTRLRRVACRAFAIGGTLALAAICARQQGSRLGLANFFSDISMEETGAVGIAENGRPVVDSRQEAFKELDPDNDGFVVEMGPDGKPLRLVDYDTFKADVKAQRTKVSIENGQKDVRDEAIYWRFMAGAGFSDKEGLDAGEIVAEPVVMPLPPNYMAVKELYTFGAPGTTYAGLFNAQVEGGCMPGLRVVTQAPVWMPAEQTIMLESDPVPSLLDFSYKHALMDFLPASTVNVRSDPIKPCSYYKDHPHNLKDSPKWDNMWWVNGHMIYPTVLKSHLDKYPASPYRTISANDLALIGGAKVARRLQESKNYKDMTVEEKVERATVMARLTFANYGPPLQAALVEEFMGWILVGAANAATDVGAASGFLGLPTDKGYKGGSRATKVYGTLSTLSDGFGDHMMLFQHKDNLECVLVFEGSGLDDVLDWFANFDFWTTEFCGFGPTHKGFRSKVLRMVAGIDYRQVIRRRIGNCASVTVGGHSLGGAQAELFAACANFPHNRVDHGYLDHRLIRLPKGEPAKMPHFFSDHVQGSFLRNKGNNLCIDVQGTLATVFRTQVIMYYCELPDSNFSKDQKWKLTPEGFIVSELSGKCIDGNETTGEARISQWPCEFGQSDTDQQWEFTPEGFLRNRKTGKCVDDNMQLYECPFTDQVWQLIEGDLIINKMSGLCVNVKPLPPGLAPGEGSELFLGECDHNSPGSWNKWEFVDFRLKNKVNGLCVTEGLQEGAIRTPNVILGPCGEGNTNKFGQFVDRWQKTEAGFIKNEYTDRCVDVPGTPGTESGVTLTVNRCEDKGIATGGQWRQDKRGFILNTGMNIKKQSKCIEIYADAWNATQETANGAELFLSFCKLNSDQKWEIRPDGKIRSVIGGQKCLSIMAGPTFNAFSPVLHWIDNCAEIDDPALFLTFKWALAPDGRFVNRFSDRCMTYITPGDPGFRHDLNLGTDEMEVVVEFCSDARHAKSWTMKEDGSIVNTETGKCLDIGSAGTDGQLPVILRQCDAARQGQRWKLLEMGILLNDAAGKCVEQVFDPNSLTQINGTHVYRQELLVMATVCPANKEMIWKFLPTGQIRNHATNKCLDAPHLGQMMPSGAPLAPYTLTEWECDERIPTQIFEAIKAPMVSMEVY